MQEERICTLGYDVEAMRAVSQLTGAAASNQIAYRQLLTRIRDAVRSLLPRDAVVAVVSKGDDDLLKLYGRRGWHFPQDNEGAYAGYHPGNSTAAIAHLEWLRSRGATHFLVPQTAWWWLDQYAEFREHLEARYRTVLCTKETCLIVSLREPADAGMAAARRQCGDLLAEFQYRHGRPPAVLDWNSGLALAEAFPLATVFSPGADAPGLPYLDRTIDVVAVAGEEEATLAEAWRVAQAARYRRCA